MNGKNDKIDTDKDVDIVRRFVYSDYRDVR